MKTEEKTKIFVDWAITKPSLYVANDSGEVKETNDLSIFEDSEIYIEYGCPYGLLKNALEKNVVFQCSGKRVKQLRGKEKKTDEVDLLYIRKLWKQDRSAFTELDEKGKGELEYKFKVNLYRNYRERAKKLKQQKKSFKKELGFVEELDEQYIKEFETKKKTILKDLKPVLQPYVDVLQERGIKGFAYGSVFEILCEAHPNKFSTLSKYLAYCGYKSSVNGEGFSYKDRKKSGATFKYNRNVKFILFNAVQNFIRKKRGTPRFREFYETCYQSFIEKGFSKAQANGKARNRVATFFLKEFYGLFKDVKDWL